LGIPDNFGHFAGIGEKEREIGAVYDNLAFVTQRYLRVTKNLGVCIKTFCSWYLVVGELAKIDRRGLLIESRFSCWYLCWVFLGYTARLFEE